MGARAPKFREKILFGANVMKNLGIVNFSDFGQKCFAFTNNSCTHLLSVPRHTLQFGSPAYRVSALKISNCLLYQLDIITFTFHLQMPSKDTVLPLSLFYSVVTASSAP